MKVIPKKSLIHKDNAEKLGDDFTIKSEDSALIGCHVSQ